MKFNHTIEQGENKLWYIYCNGQKLRGAHDSKEHAERYVKHLKFWSPDTGGLDQRQLNRM